MIAEKLEKLRQELPKDYAAKIAAIRPNIKKRRIYAVFWGQITDVAKIKEVTDAAKEVIRHEKRLRKSI